MEELKYSLFIQHRRVIMKMPIIIEIEEKLMLDDMSTWVCAGHC